MNKLFGHLRKSFDRQFVCEGEPIECEKTAGDVYEGRKFCALRQMRIDHKEHLSSVVSDKLNFKLS